MEYRLLGGSGLKVSALSFGTGTFGGTNEFFKAWGQTEVEEARRLIDICFDAGVNLFDTANGYSDGRSEEVLGKALEGKRDKALISTKSGFPTGPGPNDEGSSRYHLRNALEASLRRLGTDYVDIYHLHGFDALTPDRRSPGHAEHVRSRGQGPLHRRLQLLRLAPDEVAGHRGPLRLDPLRGAPGLLLAHWPRVRVGADAAGTRSEGRRAGLESSRLGTVDREASPRACRCPKSAACTRPPRPGRRLSDEYLYTVVDALDTVAAETGKTVPQVALNWLLQRPTVSSIILGARNEEQLRQNLGAEGWNLTKAQVETLDKASEQTPIYPYWHQRKFFSGRNPLPV